MAPLPPGQTATPSLLAAALFPVLGLLALGAWASLDARARASAHPLAWGIAVAAIPLFVVVYVLSRGERTHPPTGRERGALTVLLAILVGLMIGSVFSPPDVYAQPRPTFGGVLFALPLFYLLVYRTGPGAGDDAAESGDVESESGDVESESGDVESESGDVESENEETDGDEGGA